MKNVLSFKGWMRVYEQATVTGSTEDDIYALDRLQMVADLSPTMFNKDDLAPSNPLPETLITTVGTTGGPASSMGLANGQPYKLMEFTTTFDPLETPVRTKKVKAIFYSINGVLQATVYVNNVQTLAGEVTLLKRGDWWQLFAIGDKKGYEYESASGVQTDSERKPAPISQGITDILDMRNSIGNGAVVYKVPRGGSNVLYSKDNSVLTNFVATKRAEANPTQKP